MPGFETAREREDAYKELYDVALARAQEELIPEVREHLAAMDRQYGFTPGTMRAFPRFEHPSFPEKDVTLIEPRNGNKHVRASVNDRAPGSGLTAMYNYILLPTEATCEHEGAYTPSQLEPFMIEPEEEQARQDREIQNMRAIRDAGLNVAPLTAEEAHDLTLFLQGAIQVARHSDWT